MDETVDNIITALKLHTSLIKDLQVKLQDITVKLNSLSNEIEFIRKTY